MAIQGFSDGRPLFIVGAILVYVSFILGLVGCFTPAWVDFSEFGIVLSQGLWQTRCSIDVSGIDLDLGCSALLDGGTY